MDGEAPTLADGDAVMDTLTLGDALMLMLEVGDVPTVGHALGNEVGLGDSEVVIEGVGANKHSPKPSHVQPVVGGTKDGVSPGQRVIP